MGYIAEFNRVNAERTALTGDSGACIQKLHRELFYAWCFLAQEDLLDEALEFLAEPSRYSYTLGNCFSHRERDLKIQISLTSTLTNTGKLYPLTSGIRWM